MTYPLVALALCAAGVGLALGPSHLFFHHLSYAPGLAGEPHPLKLTVMATGTLVGVGGLLAAWWMYVARPGVADRWSKRFAGLYRLSLGKFFLDEVYSGIAVKPLEALADGSAQFDKSVVDRLVDGTGALPVHVGRWLRIWQSGLVQSYAAMMVAGGTLLVAYFVWG
jgi:NADH-quinone oxidoreductase subunit L